VIILNQKKILKIIKKDLKKFRRGVLGAKCKSIFENKKLEKIIFQEHTTNSTN